MSNYPKLLKMAEAEQGIEDLIKAFGDDPTREGLKETPKRVMLAWAEWCSGYDKDPASVFKTFVDGSEHYDEMIFVGSIPVYSHCEHHMAPFFGVAHVAYVPNGRIIGLSKISRLVEIFSRRLQVQERLSSQVADAMMQYLAPLGVGVVLQCRHMCMESRGVQKSGSITTTSALRGCIKDEPDARAEFMSFVLAENKG